MKVYKFGGASVKNTLIMRNIGKVLHIAENNSTAIVVSAIGNTTDVLEEVVDAYFINNDCIPFLDKIENEHLLIVRELFKVISAINNAIKINFPYYSFLHKNKLLNYNFFYDLVSNIGFIIFTTFYKIINIGLYIRDFIKEYIAIIFTYFSELNFKVNVIRISTISISLGVEDKFTALITLINTVKRSFKIDIINNPSLFTSEIKNDF